MSVLHDNLGGLLLPETQPISWQLISWCQQGTGTHQLSSILGKVCFPLLPYPMTVLMHIKLPSFLGLWLHLHLLVIPLYIFSSSCFPPQLFPSSCLTPQLWTVTCLHLSDGLGSDVGGLPSSSFPHSYSHCFCTPCSIFFLGLRMSMKLEVPLIFWVIPWLFLEP